MTPTKRIRDMQSLLGMLEGGELNTEISTLTADTLETLSDMSEESPKSSFKGSVTLKLDFEVKNGMVTINADMTNKVPKRPRRSSVYWIVEGGALSTEHPQQHDMFSGPREVTERAR